MRTGNGFGVLTFDVFVENRPAGNSPLVLPDEGTIEPRNMFTE